MVILAMISTKFDLGSSRWRREALPLIFHWEGSNSNYENPRNELRREAPQLVSWV
jgi:hypothetical protein